MLEELELLPNKNDLAYEIALLHLALSERDSSIVWLQTFASQPIADAFLLRLPFVAPLRSDPRFHLLLERTLKPTS